VAAFKDLIHPDLADVLELWLAEITKIIPLDLSQGISIQYRGGHAWVCVLARTELDPQATDYVSVDVSAWADERGSVVGMRWVDLHADALGFGVL